MALSARCFVFFFFFFFFFFLFFFPSYFTIERLLMNRILETDTGSGAGLFSLFLRTFRPLFFALSLEVFCLTFARSRYSV